MHVLRVAWDNNWRYKMTAMLSDLGVLAMFGAGVMFLVVAATIVRKPAASRRNRKFKQL